MSEAPPPDRVFPDIYGPRFGRVYGPPRVAYLKPIVQSPFTSVGEYTYYDDATDPLGFELRNVLFHYGPERLVIGAYCAIAQNTHFLMNAANHQTTGISAFPFPVFGGAWLEHMEQFALRPGKGDTTVGNDVWLGYDWLILPGVTIGDGAVIAARSVVASDIPPYAIAGGNPARMVRSRFDDDEIALLEQIQWWSWPVEHVSSALETIMGGSVEELAQVANKLGHLT